MRGPELAAVLVEFRQFLPLYLRECWRRIARRIAIGRGGPWPFLGKAPDRLVVAPTDLRIADPYIAHEIHQGRFPLDGRVLDTGEHSPFSLEGPSVGFDKILHSFRWLRHLRAANDAEAYGDARNFTELWIKECGRRASGVAWEPDVTAQRVIAWLSHSPIVLKNQDRNFYRRFVKSLATQIRYLHKVAPAVRDGEKRFRVRIALAMATLALPANPAAIKSAARQLDNEIEKQILADGGHISRNPQVTLILLADLLPLRQTYLNLGYTPPKGLVSVIDRMFQTLQFFRHADGSLALFNGATAQPADRLLSVLRYDEATGMPLKSTPQMNYQRLSAKGTIIIADTGPIPQDELSATAHAGCLSFELSSGRQRFIVNSGTPSYFHAQYAHLARTTAAHSTLIVGDRSSATISNSAFLGPILTDGPKNVDVERKDDATGRQGFIARHDGYAKILGLVHERSILLSADGNVVNGRDRLAKAANQKISINENTPAVIRFHIHPKIKLSYNYKNDIVLTAGNGESWTFHSPDVKPEVEEDIYFADLAGARRSLQITLTFVVSQTSQINWSLFRSIAKATPPQS